jgi:hypothetical protein
MLIERDVSFGYALRLAKPAQAAFSSSLNRSRKSWIVAGRGELSAIHTSSMKPTDTFKASRTLLSGRVGLRDCRRSSSTIYAAQPSAT